MKFKGKLALGLATVLSVSMLISCGGDKATSEDSDEIEYTAFSMMNGDYTISDNLAMKKAMDIGNIKIDFINVRGSEVAEKRNLMLNGGQYPDMFFKAELDVNRYGMQGVLIPLEDLIREYAPNLTALLDEYDAWGEITAPDGHIYGMPEVKGRDVANAKVWINNNWMNNLGLKEPSNFEELYNVLKAFKEQDANKNGDTKDEIPFFFDDYGTPLLLLQYEDFAYDVNTKLGLKDGKLFYVPVSEEFKEFLAYLTKLYREGLMYEHSFTTSHEQGIAIGQSGDVLGAFIDVPAFTLVGRDNDDDYIALTPWNDLLPLTSGIVNGCFAITDKCEKPEKLVAWMDYFYSTDGGRLAWMGIEGETYEMNDDGTWQWILGKGYGDDIATVRASATIQGACSHPSVKADLWNQMSPTVDPDEVYLIQETEKLIKHGKVSFPTLTYTEAQSKELSNMLADMNSYIEQYIAQVVTGEEQLDSSWNNYVDSMNTMGAPRVIQIYQEVYEASLTQAE